MFTRIETDGTDMRMRLYGALDGSGAQALRAGVAAALGAPQGELLLDMTGVNFIDDDGLGAVVFLFKQLAARRRRMRVVGVSDSWLARLRDLGLAELVGPATPFGTLGTPPRRRRPAVLH
jgi:anti-anti-sigma factor